MNKIVENPKISFEICMDRETNTSYYFLRLPKFILDELVKDGKSENECRFTRYSKYHSLNETEIWSIGVIQ